MTTLDAFAARLLDVLSTLESTAVLGAAERRLRSLGSLLRFACVTVPCDEALVAIELEHLGRMHVPGVATADEWRPADVELSPLGTPFAFLFAGGGGHAAELVPDDPMLAALAGLLRSTPRHGVFVPVRLGAEVVGGVALLDGSRRTGDRELLLGEQLADVTSGAVEAYRTERALLEVFALALPELVSSDGETGFARELERYVHSLRLAPEYRRRLALAGAIGRLAGHGDAAVELAARLIADVERYLDGLGAAVGTPSGPLDGAR